MRATVICTAGAACLADCTTFDGFGTGRSTRELESDNSYAPASQIPAKIAVGNDCEVGKSAGLLLDAVPDDAVRMLVERFDESGYATCGTSKIAAKSRSDRVADDCKLRHSIEHTGRKQEMLDGDAATAQAKALFIGQFYQALISPQCNRTKQSASYRRRSS